MDGNISLALQNISRDIHPIGILKCRFSSVKAGIYGLFLFIFNVRYEKIVRIASVAGCNPEICETNINDNWFSFEKELYSKRLKEGSLRDVTQNMEQTLLKKLDDKKPGGFFDMYRAGDSEGISALMEQGIREVVKYDTGEDCLVDLMVRAQRLNLRQFRYLTDSESVAEEFKLQHGDEPAYSTLVALDTEIVKVSGTPVVRVEKIEAGDMVFTKIKDMRDIGIYLSHLLGARKDDDFLPIPSTVADVKETKEGIELVVRFGPGIVGRSLEDPRKKISIWRPTEAKPPWRLYVGTVALALIVLYYLLFLR